MANKLIACEKALAQLALFLTQNDNIINVCMVDFVTLDIFENKLNQQIKNDLLKLTDQELMDLPSKFILKNTENPQQSDSQSSNSCLEQFLVQISSLTLESLAVTTSKDQFQQTNDDHSILSHFDHVMSEKKMHEVLLLSDVVSQLAKNQNVTSIIDVGSGKAYLTQFLGAMQNQLCILAIDASSGNLKGAQKRSAILEKSWQALIRRASCRANGEQPPKRGKHWKSKQNSQLEIDKLILSNVSYDTVFVNPNTDLKSLFETHFDNDQDGSKFGLMGLHTCGNLAPDSLKIFLANPNMKFCCNVGCCYHHLDEEFYVNPHHGCEEKLKLRPSFPISNVLKNMKFQLGRNARMVGAQAMDRLINNKTLPNESLLWRAILQHILLKHKPDLGFDEQQVGRIAAKSKHFVDYVEKGFAKIGLELKMTTEELNVLFKEYKDSFGHKLNAFYTLRSFFAPLIEGLILLDRLTFLLQQSEISEAHLVRLFDAVISPRCYALISIKK